MNRITLAISGCMHHITIVPTACSHHILVPAHAQALIIGRIYAIVTVLALCLKEIARILYTAVVAYPCIATGVYGNILYVAMHPVVALVTTYCIVAVVCHALLGRTVERSEAIEHMCWILRRCTNHHIKEALSTCRVHNWGECSVPIFAALVGLVFPVHAAIL